MDVYVSFTRVYAPLYNVHVCNYISLYHVYKQRDNVQVNFSSNFLVESRVEMRAREGDACHCEHTRAVKCVLQIAQLGRKIWCV